MESTDRFGVSDERGAPGEHARSEPDSRPGVRTFRPYRPPWWLTLIQVAGVILAASVVFVAGAGPAGLDEIEWFSHAETPALIGFVAAVVVVVGHNVYKRWEAFVLEEDGIAHETLTMTTAIPFTEIMRIQRQIENGVEHATIRGRRQDIVVPSALPGYMTLLAQLESIAPVRWKTERPVRIPLTVPINWRKDAIIIGASVALTLPFPFLSQAFLPLFVLLMAAAAIVLLRTPREYVFHADRIRESRGLRRRVLAVEYLREIAFQEYQEVTWLGWVVLRRRLELRLQSRTIHLEQAKTNVPLGLVHELLCKTYNAPA